MAMNVGQLSKICMLNQTQTKNYITKKLKRMGYEPETKDGYVYAKGTYPVLLCAHMDTVHKETVKTISFGGENGKIMSSPQGIGGDDRCGIFLILNIIREINCSVLFLEDEEIGCVGAGKFAKDCNGNLGNNYIIEFDRRGYNDCVFYDLDNKEFEQFCESTGYFKKNFGSCSDISIIAPAMGIAAVNLSSGYYNEHTKNESIRFNEVEVIYEKAKELILKEVDKPFEWKEVKYSWSNWNYSRYDNMWDDDFDSYYYSYYAKKRNQQSTYHIYTEEYEKIWTYEVTAESKEEALGLLFMKYPKLCYEQVLEIHEG